MARRTRPGGKMPRRGKDRLVPRIEPMKQVIVVNESLNLPRGKLAAQVAHAAVQAFVEAPSHARRDWMEAGMPKIVLRAESEEDLRALESKAVSAGLPVALIADAGRTVIEADTTTCLAIGPAQSDLLDLLTGDLKLVR